MGRVRVMTHVKNIFGKMAVILGLTLLQISCQNNEALRTSLSFEKETTQSLWSAKGKEHAVEFSALYRSSFTSLESYEKSNKQNTQKNILHLLKFLAGPLTHREWAGIYPQNRVELEMEKAFLKEGVVFIPYRYSGKWLISHEVKGESFKLPVPFQSALLQTLNWKSCGDSNPDHQYMSFLWYYWDPERFGCDHEEGQHYQVVDVLLREETLQTRQTTPEYDKLVRNVNGVPTLEMTFGFGYVEDPSRPDPFQDSDSGAWEFRKFHQTVSTWAQSKRLSSKPVSPQDYGYSSDQKIGTEWTGTFNGIRYVVRVVMAAEVDQMELFAKSFAEKHEGFFGWFGHSRVGSGFDADRLKEMIFQSPETYSISESYQLVYWGGCNSYAYYSQPFFDMKRNESSDPFGTKGLDLITNALPSYFSLNAINASIVFEALVNMDQQITYQSMVQRIEIAAGRWGIDVLVNVLGDEDNSDEDDGGL